MLRFWSLASVCRFFLRSGLLASARYGNLARVLASLEVLSGIMLLLFGVSELLEYAREHRRDRRSE
jgi:energy-converting hydrogenase Eha subunit C